MVESKTVNSFRNVIQRSHGSRNVIQRSHGYGLTFDSQQQSDNACKRSPGYWKISDYNKCGTFGCYAPRTLN